MQVSTRERFTDKMYVRLLVPAVISAVGSSIADMADAIVVGQRTGEIGLAAIALCLPIYNIMNVFIVSLSTGGSVAYSHRMAVGKHEEGRKLFSWVLWAGVFLGFLLAAAGLLFRQNILRVLGTVPEDGLLYRTALEYAELIICGTPVFFASFILNAFLRNDDNQKLAATGFTIASFVDLTLNVVFVLLLDMGARGAALATLIGQSVAVCIYLLAFIRKENRRTLAFARFTPDFRLLGRIFGSGFSVASQFVCSLLFLNIINRILMAKAGANGVAVFDVLYNAAILVTYLYNAASNAMQPLTATFHSEYNTGEEKRTLGLALVSGCALGGIITLFIELFPQLFCSLFGLNGPEILAMGMPALRIYAPSLMLAGISITYATYYQSIERSKASFLIVFLRTGALLIPSVVLFARPPIRFFWYSFLFVEIVTLCVVAVIRNKANRSPKYDPERVLSRTIRNDDGEFASLLRETEEFCERWGADMKQSMLIYSAVEEICVIIGRMGMKGNEGFIQLTMVSLENGDVELHVRDTADAFNPFALQTKRASTDDDFDVDTMGILLLKKKAKDFYYRQFQGFNVLVIRV